MSRFCKNRTHSFLVAIRSNRFVLADRQFGTEHRFAMDNRGSNWSQRACNGSKQSVDRDIDANNPAQPLSTYPLEK